MNYLLNTVVSYRVPTEVEALKLRDTLNSLKYASLIAFSYTEKPIKVKGEVVDVYYIVKAKLEVNSEKEPESAADISIGLPEVSF